MASFKCSHSENSCIPLILHYNSRILTPQNRKSCSWSLLKFPHPAPVFSRYPKHHHEIKPNPTPTNPIVDPKTVVMEIFKLPGMQGNHSFSPYISGAHKFICYCAHKQSDTWEWGKGGTSPFTCRPLAHPLLFSHFSLCSSTLSL